jgi:hypothetical protein
MKKTAFILITALMGLSTSAFASLTKQQIRAYEKQGYAVFVGSVDFNAGYSTFSIPGTSICTDGTNLRAGSVQVCEDNSTEETSVRDCAPDSLKTYSLKTPIRYREQMITPEGGFPECQSEPCFANRTQPNGVVVLVGTENGGEGGSPSDIANTDYIFPACGK